MITSTEEDYIKAIYSISRNSKKELVGTNQIAQAMRTSAASATDMMRKLSAKDLVDYEKYKGVKLTSEGTEKAIMLLRKHRLWESFLVDKLGFGWDEVHPIAEQLEHIHSELLIDKLDSYLGNPKFDPHGDPIPDKQGLFTLRNQCTLQQINVGEKATLVGVRKHDYLFLHHLNDVKIELGTVFEVLNHYEYDQSVKVLLNDAVPLTLSKEISENLYLEKL